MLQALLFDCDGVLVDTERDGHRIAFNRAFKAKNLGVEWDVPLYGELLKIAGGKERMTHFFDTHGWPSSVTDKSLLIRDLHQLKTEIFMQVIASGELPLRPGVARLVDEAIGAGVKLAVCSTSNEKAVETVVSRMLGQTRRKAFQIFAGDVVEKKKPAPDIYLLAAKKMGKLKPTQCLVIEDSRNGLLAAKAAGMKCLVTKSAYTQDEDFTEADVVHPELGDDPARVRLVDLVKLCG